MGKLIAYIISLVAIAEAFWEQIKCGVIVAICFIVEQLWASLAAVLTFFVNMLQTATGGISLDFNPLIQYAAYVNCIIPLDIGVALVTVYATFQIAFIVFKMVSKKIPTIG